MTYPPQPGQPGPPYGQDPQGQQPGGYPQQPYPQQGGWDQTQQYGQQQGWDQTQQYPQQGAWDPNAQQQQGWDPNNPGYTQGFGGPPAPPPNKSKTGLIIGIAIAAVVLIAFGVTGFVAPGFLLSKDENTAAPPPASSSSKAPSSAPKSTKKSAPPTTESTESGGSSTEGDPKGIQALKDFFAKANAGDKAGALALTCEEDKAGMDQTIDSMIPSGSKVEVKTTTGLGKDLVTGDLAGTVKGKEVTGLAMAKAKSGGDFCLTSFFVF